MKKAFFVFLISWSCATTKNYVTTGEIEEFHPDLKKIISSNNKPEVIAQGYRWTEGPLWVKNKLLFSDVPSNTIYEWTEKDGAKVYLSPSGFTGEKSDSKEPGSNGLALHPNGKLVLSQHGDRQIALMNAPVNKPLPKFISVVNKYKGLRFSSPNDVVVSKKGEYFFTDPPYGLPSQGDADPLKEISFNGVYKVTTTGQVILLTDTLTRPNGIALFPDEKQLLVANSDPAKPNWYIYDIEGDQLKNGRIFYSMKTKGLPGSPDGLKIDKRGNVYASGPGGICIFNSSGVFLGRVRLKDPASNCALSEDEKTLYITNNKQVLRFKMRD